MKVLLYGAERYLLEKQAQAIIEKKHSYAKDIEPLLFDCENYEFSWNHLMEEILTVSFFEPYKIIYCINPQAVLSDLSQASLNQLLDLLEHLGDDVLFFMMVDQPSYDKRLKLFKLFSKNREVLEVASLNYRDFRNIVITSLKEHNLHLGNVELDALLDRLDMHVLSLQQEIKKLATYPGKLSVDVIDELIAKPISENVFDLSKAIMLKDYKGTWSIYQKLLIQKYDQTALIPAIAWQYRIMHHILHYKQEDLSQFEIQKRLKEHDYTFRKAWEYANKTSKDTVEKLINELAQLDQAIKGGLTDKKIGFERFLLEAMK